MARQLAWLRVCAATGWLPLFMASCAACGPPTPVTNCVGPADCPIGYRCDRVRQYCYVADTGPSSTKDGAVESGLADHRFDANRADTLADHLIPDRDLVDVPLDASATPDGATAFDGNTFNDGSIGDVALADRSGTDRADAGIPSRRVLRLLAGVGHSCAILSDGSIKCWGGNDFGQLGLGDALNRGDNPGEMGRALPEVALGSGVTAVPGAVGSGSFHLCVRSSGELKCWGNNSDGQLGYGDYLHRGDNSGEMGNSLGAVALNLGSDFMRELHVGGSTTCIEPMFVGAKCWGGNAHGELGLGDNAPRSAAPAAAISLGTGVPSGALYVGSGHLCARCQPFQDHHHKCWGRNDYGQLGLGDREHRGDNPDEMGDRLPRLDLGVAASEVQSIAMGGLHSCALLQSDRVKCWGNNGYGQLGLGDFESRGDDQGEMGAALPVLQFGHGQPVAELALGTKHTCARFVDGCVKCWGINEVGQLGYGDTLDRGDQAGEMGGALPCVALGSGRSVQQLAVGDMHACALLDTGQVKCWGASDRGQLGYGDTSSRGDNAQEMGDWLPGVDLGL